MKKLISLIMSILFIGLPLYGCNKTTNPNDVTENTTPAPNNETENPAAPEISQPVPGENGDTNLPETNTTEPPVTENTTPQPPVTDNTTPQQPANNNTNNTATPQQPAGNAESNTNQASGNLVTDILNSTNAERQKQGLEPLKLNNDVSKLAAMKSKDMYDKNYFSHTSPTYGDPGKMLTDNGLRYAAMGENIYTSTGMTPTGEYTVNQWMNSPGHRANILSTNYDEIGIGVYYNNGKYYATQIFYKA